MAENLDKAKEYAAQEHSVTSIAKLLGVSPGTFYNHIPDLKELRAAGAVPRQLEAGCAVIPCWHRRKGGAPVLGARRPGEAGPFGMWSDDGDDGTETTCGSFMSIQDSSDDVAMKPRRAS